MTTEQHGDVDDVKDAVTVDDDVVDETAIDFWTQQYRQSILDLATTSGEDDSHNNNMISTFTEISFMVSQRMLDKIWETSSQRRNTDTTPRSTPSATSSTTVRIAGTSKSNSTKDTQNHVVVYACQECGHTLFPGRNGTQLRVERPKDRRTKDPTKRRTIRRRQQRKHKKAVRRKAMQARVVVSSSPQPVLMGNNTTFGSKRNTMTAERLVKDQKREVDDDDAFVVKDYTLMLLDDDPDTNPLDRNQIVIKCGHCHAKYRFKGPKQMKVSPKLSTSSSVLAKATRQQQWQPLRNNHSFQQRKGKDSNPITVVGSESKSITLTDSTATTGTPLENNFEALPPSSTKRPSKNNERRDRPFITSTFLSSSTTARVPGSSMTLLQQRQVEKFGERKKKKKRTGGESNDITSNGGKNKLLSFLSSLNDH